MDRKVKLRGEPQASSSVSRKRRCSRSAEDSGNRFKNDTADNCKNGVKKKLPVKRKKIVKSKVHSDDDLDSVILSALTRPQERSSLEKPTTKQKTERLKKSRIKSSPDENDYGCLWKDEEYLANSEDISLSTAVNLITLLKEENTIPFIARYRADLTGGLPPDKLRKIKATYENIQEVHEKAEQLIRKVKANDALTPEVLSHIQLSQTLDELDFIGSQFKKDSKKNLAERARQLGLATAAELMLEGKPVNLGSYVNPKSTGLENIEKVKLGIQHIIADVISKNLEVLSFLEKIYSSEEVLVVSKFKQSKNDESSSKYDLYGNFSQPVRTIKPHQTLAINRGESENVLSQKIVIPDHLWTPLKNFCMKKWLKSEDNSNLTKSIFIDSLNDAIKRLLSPLAVRRIKAKLNQAAENEALLVFGSNLRQLLMTPPITGSVVMGIDPGFRNGCKVAIVSQVGSYITHDKFFLDQKPQAELILKKLILKHECGVIALGNGMGCRETETLLTDLIKKNVFKPVNVSYTIVSEQGVSIYSCSVTAAEEFPNLEPTFISAVSVARRLQNPLSELVKVEPKHLGVGMYQHDVKDKKLISLLDDIVSECVSFVGVDINTASLCLLRRVAGLNNTKAQEILKYRAENCTFKSRDSIKNVKGIKAKTFQQCAGFIRIVSSTAKCDRHLACKCDLNPLDETAIHPESYKIALKLMKLFGVYLSQLGNAEFVTTIKNAVKQIKIEQLSAEYGCFPSSLSFLIETLMRPKNFDMRSVSAGPIFRKGVRKLEELSPGQELEGVVRNIVTFGAFVDIGVGSNGLIHSSQMRENFLQLNDRVKVKVTSVNLTSARIQLKLICVIK